MIADGSGEYPQIGCVAVMGGKIIAVEPEIADDRAETLIDANGLMLSSGFIDSHGHSDISLLAAPEATGKLSQGITTEIAGNCGLSVFPVTIKNREHLQELFAKYNVKIDWDGISDYAARIDACGPAINLASLCGHNTLRASVLGYSNVSVSDIDIGQMCERLRNSLKNGAIGFSSGLLYVPGKFADKDEFLQLGRIIRESDKIWTSHLRSEGNNLLEAIDEFIGTAKQVGCRNVHISHLKTAGKANWNKLNDAFLRISQADEFTFNVTADRYPYIESMTQLSAYMPSPYSDMDDVALMEYLHKPANFAEFIAVLDRNQSNEDWERRRLVATAATFATCGVGRSFIELAEMLAMSPATICAKLLKRDSPGTMAASRGMSEENMMRIMEQPFVCCCTDESARPEDFFIGRSHPRGFGSFPEFFRRLQPIVGAGETIRKMTSLPAEIFALEQRGRVVPGYYADLVLFDPDKIMKTENCANFANPHVLAEGIEKVWVNGVLSCENKRLTGNRSGKFLM